MTVQGLWMILDWMMTWQSATGTYTRQMYRFTPGWDGQLAAIYTSEISSTTHGLTEFSVSLTLTNDVGATY